MTSTYLCEFCCEVAARPGSCSVCGGSLVDVPPAGASVSRATARPDQGAPPTQAAAGPAAASDTERAFLEDLFVQVPGMSEHFSRIVELLGAGDLADALQRTESRGASAAQLARLNRQVFGEHSRVVSKVRLRILCDQVSLMEAEALPAAFGPAPASDVSGLMTLAEEADEEAAGRFMVVRRGGETFVRKARAAMSRRAAACVVCNTTDVWPYTMRNSQEEEQRRRGEPDVNIPIVMVSREDGGRLLKLLQGESREHLEGRFVVEDGDMRCPVCISAFSQGDRMLCLPCGHDFHEDCIVQWLRQRATCPMCRKDIAQSDQTGEQDSEDLPMFN